MSHWVISTLMGWYNTKEINWARIFAWWIVFRHTSLDHSFAIRILSWSRIEAIDDISSDHPTIFSMVWLYQFMSSLHIAVLIVQYLLQRCYRWPSKCSYQTSLLYPLQSFHWWQKHNYIISGWLPSSYWPLVTTPPTDKRVNNTQLFVIVFIKFHVDLCSTTFKISIVGRNDLHLVVKKLIYRHHWPMNFIHVCNRVLHGR